MSLNIGVEQEMLLGSPQDRKRANYRIDNPITPLNDDLRKSTIIVAKDGTGDTDDIQEGIRLLGKGGGTVEVRAGTYLITSQISFTQNEQTLKGTGRGTVIQTSGNIRAIYINKVDCTVENLKILGNRTAGNFNEGILCTSADVRIFNLEIEKMGANGLNLNSSEARINNCEIWDCADSGISCGGNTKNIIMNCHIHHNDQDGIEIDGISNYYVIIGNSISDNEEHGILLSDAGRTVISSNTITNNGGGVTFDGLHIEETSDNNTITGNLIFNSGGWGIEIDNAVDTPDRTTIVGNNVVGNTQGAINDNGTNTIKEHNQT